MSDPRYDRQTPSPPPEQWVPPPPGYAPPPGQYPPPPYPSQSPDAPPPGPPLPPPSPATDQRRDRGGLVAGVVIISIGVFFLVSQFVPDIGRSIPLLIGLVFLAVFLVTREYGFLIPGCIVSGVGVGVVLAGVVDDQWSGAVVLLSIAGGFIAIWIVSVVLRLADKDWPRGASREAAQALWWPLIPGGIIALVAVVVLAEEGFESDVLRWWPLLLIGAGVVVLISALSRRGNGRAP